MASKDELESGLFGMSLSLSDPEETEKPRTRAEKNAQSENEFQRLRAQYTVKVENGEVSHFNPAVHEMSKDHDDLLLLDLEIYQPPLGGNSVQTTSAGTSPRS